MNQPVTLDRMHKGVDSTSEGILVDPAAWRTHHNMRPFNGRIDQVPRKAREMFVESCHEHPVLALVNIPVARNDYGHLVAITAEYAFQIRYPSPAVKLQDVTGDLPFEYDARYLRWGTTVYNGCVYFINEANRLLMSNGTWVKYAGNDTPQARYITNYFDHIVLGHVIQDGIVMPGRMHWSDLYRLSSWRPGRGNESDHWDFEEDDTGISPVTGLTGMEKLGDTLFVFTPTSIRPVRYVGLPKVFQVGPNVSGGLGNGLKWTLIRAGNQLFFYDTNEMNFFAFNGVQVQPIGSAVQGYLSTTATLDPELQQRTWAYHQPEFYEVVWVFCSRTSTGNFDKAVCFNYRTGTWYTRSVENLHSFGGRIRRELTASELTGSASALSGMAMNLGNTGRLLPRYWGGADGTLWREETSLDATANLAEQETPVLETGDQHMGDLQTYKESDTLCIHSSYVEAKGVQVEAAGRDYVDDAVSYKAPVLWTPYVSHKRLTTVRLSGRIFRYRFYPESIGDSTEYTQACAKLPCRDRIGIELVGAALSNFAPADYVPTGPTESLNLTAYRATEDGRPDLDMIYLHGAPGTYDMYTHPNSSGMLADLRAYGASYLGGRGFDGFTEPRWLYAGSWGTYAQPVSDWPGYRSIPVLITQGFYLEMSAFNWADQTSPPVGYGPNNAQDSDSFTAICSGDGEGPYAMSFRIRGAAMLNTYTGGTVSGYTSVWGTPSDTSREVIKIEVSSPAQTVYLNHGATPTDYLVPLDYLIGLIVNANATVTISGTRNRPGATVGINGAPVYVAGLGSLETTKIQVDASYYRANNAAYRTLSIRQGGGVRGWKWSGMTQNVRAVGAQA